MWGAGGGGGGGEVGGNANSSGGAGGGSGKPGGAVEFSYAIPSSGVSSFAQIVVGSGGAGGGTNNSSDPTNQYGAGSAGTPTSFSLGAFGNVATIYGGGGGSGGTHYSYSYGGSTGGNVSMNSVPGVNILMNYITGNGLNGQSGNTCTGGSGGAPTGGLHGKSGAGGHGGYDNRFPGCTSQGQDNGLTNGSAGQNGWVEVSW